MAPRPSSLLNLFKSDNAASTQAATLIQSDRKLVEADACSPLKIPTGSKTTSVYSLTLGALPAGYHYFINGAWLNEYHRNVTFHDNLNGFSKAYLAAFEGLEIRDALGNPFLDVAYEINRTAKFSIAEFWKAYKRHGNFDDLTTQISWVDKTKAPVEEHSIPVIMVINQTPN